MPHLTHEQKSSFGPCAAKPSLQPAGEDERTVASLSVPTPWAHNVDIASAVAFTRGLVRKLRSSVSTNSPRSPTRSA